MDGEVSKPPSGVALLQSLTGDYRRMDRQTGGGQNGQIVIPRCGKRKDKTDDIGWH